MSNLNHIGIIMDGNRRYAKKYLLNPLKGHDKGAETIKKIIETAKQNNIKQLSLYTFSIKNFQRQKTEVDHLMNLFKEKFKEFSKSKEFKEVKINFCGKLSMFENNIQTMMNELMNKTKDNKKLIINFCMAYDGQEEIVHATNECIKNNLKIDQKNIQKNLYISTPLDLIIRTSGENRLSGFLLWLSSYAEIYFTKKLWPEFNKDEFLKAIDEYKNRNRRFGR